MSLKSYFYPQLIYKNSNDKNSIKVVERYGKFHMMINDYPQTNPQYRANWRRLLTQNLNSIANRNPKILVLGLGGGDVIKEIQKLLPGMKITAIEIDQEVILVAKNYFNVEGTKTLKIICDDAERFLRKNREKFDLIIVDLYDGDDVPSFVEKSSFIKKVAESTSHNGLAIFNFASHSFRENNYNDFQKKLNKYYTNVIIKKYWGHNYYVTHN